MVYRKYLHIFTENPCITSCFPSHQKFHGETMSPDPPWSPMDSSRWEQGDKQLSTIRANSSVEMSDGRKTKKKRALLIGEIQIPSVFLQNMSVPQFQLPWMVGYGRYPPFGFQRFHQQEPDSPGRFGYIPQFDGHEKKRKSWWGRQKKKKKKRGLQ